MSRPNPSEEARLRERIGGVLKEPPPTASLYLRTLGCLYLAAEAGTGGEDALEAVYYRQAELEDLEGDDLLTSLILLAQTTEAVNAES